MMAMLAMALGDDPKVIEAYEKYDFVRRYLSTEDYQKFVPKLAAEERAALEKLGLARTSD